MFKTRKRAIIKRLGFSLVITKYCGMRYGSICYDLCHLGRLKSDADFHSVLKVFKSNIEPCVVNVNLLLRTSVNEAIIFDTVNIPYSLLLADIL